MPDVCLFPEALHNLFWCALPEQLATGTASGNTSTVLVRLMDRHVRVDFFYQRQSARWQARLNLLGNTVFAAPFFAMAIQASWSFTARAWKADEGSRNAGLNDLWLIKSVLPLGLSVLALAVLIETVRLLREAR